MAAEPRMILGREIEIGTQSGGIADTRAVGMGIIERAAELGMVIHIKIGMTELQKAPHLTLGTSRGDVLAVIGVSQIGRRRRQYEDLGPISTVAPVARGEDEEGNVVLAGRFAVILAAFYMQRIGPLLTSAGIANATVVSQPAS